MKTGEAIEPLWLAPEITRILAIGDTERFDLAPFAQASLDGPRQGGADHPRADALAASHLTMAAFEDPFFRRIYRALIMVSRLVVICAYLLVEVVRTVG